MSISFKGGLFMNNGSNPEKYRKLPVVSLITGILSYICMLLMWLIFDILLRGVNFSEIIITILTFTVFGLPIAAIVCGSIDLNKIKRGQYSIKGKGFDIAGIVFGSVFILAVICFALADAPMFQ
jgi:amino acid transporter